MPGSGTLKIDQRRSGPSWKRLIDDNQRQRMSACVRTDLSCGVV